VRMKSRSIPQDVSVVRTHCCTGQRRIKNAFGCLCCGRSPRHCYDNSGVVLRWALVGNSLIMLIRLMSCFADEVDFDCLQLNDDPFNVLLDQLSVSWGNFAFIRLAFLQMIADCLGHCGFDVRRADAHYAAGLIITLLQNRVRNIITVPRAALPAYLSITGEKYREIYIWALSTRFPK
jgi:hypothetical protein